MSTWPLYDWSFVLLLSYVYKHAAPVDAVLVDVLRVVEFPSSLDTTKTY